MCSILFQTSESTEQKEDSKDKEGDAEKETKGKKDNGTPPKKKKQQVKTIDLQVETTVPALTAAQLQDAIEREVCGGASLARHVSFHTSILVGLIFGSRISTYSMSTH